VQASVVTPTSNLSDSSSSPALEARNVAFDDIARADWDRLLARTAAATPFSRWNFHRAWWDAYGSGAHEQYTVMTGADGEVRAIVPLMHRHEIEADDVPTHTTVREHSPTCRNVDGEKMAVMFGASYHADYATILAASADLQPTAEGLVGTLRDGPRFDEDQAEWDVVDLRRLAGWDPALAALEAAFGMEREQEDVCPVVDVLADTWDDYLATLDKKDRHEIRRKLRRAMTIGDLSIEIGPPTPEAVGDFIRLHTLRFGEDGLFPNNEGGARSRLFIERLAELERNDRDGGQLHVARVRCGEKLIFTALAFDDGRTCFLYNAGMDPAAALASPGVSGFALYIRDRLEAGRRRFDFLRGNEKYKYEWGAVDQPIYRLLVQRGSPGDAA
jgi:CelD/BcsL family acetyltransferase involved in cellulose biosynthesis